MPRPQQLHCLVFHNPLHFHAASPTTVPFRTVPHRTVPWLEQAVGYTWSVVKTHAAPVFGWLSRDKVVGRTDQQEMLQCLLGHVFYEWAPQWIRSLFIYLLVCSLLIPCITLALFLSRSGRGHWAGYNVIKVGYSLPSPLRYPPSFLSREEFNIFLPSSTRVELCFRPLC